MVGALSLPINAGLTGVQQTLSVMIILARAGRKNPNVRQFTADLVSALPPKRWRMEIDTVFNFVRDEVRYTRDIDGTETLYPAEQILLQRYGDCDDKAVLLASMLGSIGHPCRFVALGFEPGVLSHVIVDTRAGTYADGSARWLPLDATMEYNSGWFPPDAQTIMGPRYV